MRRGTFTLICLGLILTGSIIMASDFPYSPATWRTPICFPNDWLKTLVDHRGALNYDSGPGPYAKPGTIISAGVKEHSVQVVRQTLHSAKVPIVKTHFTGDKVEIEQTAFALVPSEMTTAASYEIPDSRVRRQHGYVGAIAWTDPAGHVDPAFRNVAWGTGRPITYILSVEPGSRKQVALGFCDGYRKKESRIRRIMNLKVEGAPPLKIDLMKNGDRNQPQVFVFDAEDRNGDGQIELEITSAPETSDGNILLNVIWAFSEGVPLDLPDLIAGNLTDKAEIYVDCGNEPVLQQLPLRQDAILSKFSGKRFTPVVRIQTGRELNYDKNFSGLVWRHRRFLSVSPQAKSYTRTPEGWLIEFAPNTPEVRVIVHQGVPAMHAMPDLAAELQNSVHYWENEAGFPWEKFQVPDERVQALVEAGMRNMFQLSDFVDGYSQFQPGPTVYRGFWASDGVWYSDAALLIGRAAAGRRTVERFLNYQLPGGRVEIMSPSLLHRETPHFIWMLYRYVAFSGDTDYLRANWSALEHAVAHIRELRKIASQDTGALYFGLVPPGLTDGGIGGVNAEYSGVYWGLIGYKAAIECAHILGKSSQTNVWQNEFDQFMAAFLDAAERDTQTDSAGNAYLPMKMGLTENVAYPQRGQAGFLQAVFPGKVLDERLTFVKGLLEFFNQHRVQGLLQDSGWLKNGVWPFFSAHRGLAELWLGRTGRAQAALFAFADHASPTLIWAEEQLPVHLGTKVTGDMPQGNSNAQFIRLLRHLLVLERDADLELLSGLPAHWIFPGARLMLNEIPTSFGDLTLKLEIDASGSSAGLSVPAIGANGKSGEIRISLQALKNAGFTFEDSRPLPEIFRFNFGESVSLKMKKM